MTEHAVLEWGLETPARSGESLVIWFMKRVCTSFPVHTVQSPAATSLRAWTRAVSGSRRRRGPCPSLVPNLSTHLHAHSEQGKRLTKLLHTHARRVVLATVDDEHHAGDVARRVREEVHARVRNVRCPQPLSSASAPTNLAKGGWTNRSRRGAALGSRG